MPGHDAHEKEIVLKPIGVIRTPYTDWAPSQPPEREPEREGLFRLELNPDWVEGLDGLERFSHIYVLFHLHAARKSPRMKVAPPWAGGKRVGLFASRSPDRPNPLALSIVRVHRVSGNQILISPIDALDRSPLLDIKPYFRALDAREEANSGWADDLEDREHAFQHLRALPHEHGHHHDHKHGHDHHDS